MRVPGLPIRNCADISNNLVQRVAEVSSIDVTDNVIFERLYLVSGLCSIALFVTMPFGAYFLTSRPATMSRDSVRRALGRVPRRARGRHGLRRVGFGDLRKFKGGFHHERFPINSFALTRVRLV